MLYVVISGFDARDCLGSEDNWSAILDESCTYAILTGIDLYYYRLGAVKIYKGCLE